MIRFLSVIYLVIIVSLLLSGCDSYRATQKLMENVEEAAEVRETEEQRRIESRSEFEKFIADTISMRTRHKNFEEKIINYGTNNGNLHITLVASFMLDGDAVRLGILVESMQIIEAVYKTFPDINYIFFTWQYPFADTKGHEGLHDVLTLGIDRETAESINWENFRTKNFKVVAQHYEEYVAFK